MSWRVASAPIRMSDCTNQLLHQATAYINTEQPNEPVGLTFAPMREQELKDLVKGVVDFIHRNNGNRCPTVPQPDTAGQSSPAFDSR
eukprot:scaffold40051_cov23-Prasinocladus_malaysianus.AAC.5